MGTDKRINSHRLATGMQEPILQIYNSVGTPTTSNLATNNAFMHADLWLSTTKIAALIAIP